jgi:hypothetical protein
LASNSLTVNIIRCSDSVTELVLIDADNGEVSQNFLPAPLTIFNNSVTISGIPNGAYTVRLTWRRFVGNDPETGEPQYEDRYTFYPEYRFEDGTEEALTVGCYAIP